MLATIAAFLVLMALSVTGRAAETTITFSSTSTNAWSDGIAEDGDGGSADIPGKVIQFYPISDTDGTHLNLPLIHPEFSRADGFVALTTYDPSVNDDGFKGMAIRSQDGSAFQLNGFFYSNWGEGGATTITVKGYNDGVEVASTTFTTALVDFYQSKTVTLDGSFDHVDEVRVFSADGLSWHGLNDVRIDDAGTLSSTGIGELAVIGWSSLTNRIRIAVLADIAAGSTVHFTDLGWTNHNAFSSQATADGTVTWTPAATVAKGTILSLYLGGTAYPTTLSNLTAGTSLTSEISVVGYTVSDAIANNGDGLFIYRGSDANPFFIFGFNNSAGTVDAGGWNTSVSITLRDSKLPDGTGSLNALTNGVNAIGFTTQLDNVHYTGPTSMATAAAWLTRIADAANWSGDDTGTTVSTIGTSLSIGSANAAPAIGQFSGDTVTYTEGGAPVVIDQNADATVTDGDSADFNGGELRVSIVGNKSGEEVLSIATNGTVSLSFYYNPDDDVLVGGVSVGKFIAGGSGTGGSDLTLALNSGATPARIQSLVRTLALRIPVPVPTTATRSVAVTLTDGDGGSVSVTNSVAVTLVNTGGGELKADFTDNGTTTGDSLGNSITENGIVVSLRDGSGQLTGAFLYDGPIADGSYDQGAAVNSFDNSYGAGNTDIRHISIRRADNTNFKFVGFTWDQGLDVARTFTLTAYDASANVIGSVDVNLAANDVDQLFLSGADFAEDDFLNVREVRITANHSANPGWGYFYGALQAVGIADPVTSNHAPTDLALSNASVNQSAGANATVGTLSTTDADGSDTHTYTLVSGAGDTDNASFNISGSTLRANDASALAAGNYSVRIQTDDGNDGTHAEAFTITVVNDAGPTVVSVAAPTNGTYRASVFLDFTVSFTEPVTVLGVPALELIVGETARTATFHSGGGTTNLVFRHTVQVGDEDTDGVAVGALTLAGGTIRDAAANNAVLTLNNVAATTGVLVDGVAPLVSSVTRKTPSQQTTDETTVVFEVTFSEDVTNVDASAFAVMPVNGGTITGTVSGVSGGPKIYDVTVQITGGLGEFRLEVAP